MTPTLPRRPLGVLLAVCMLAAPAKAAAKEPPLTVPKAKLAAALHCAGKLKGARKQPLMLVTGTGYTGGEAYAIAKGAVDLLGNPVCYVDFPDFTTADMQVSVQYLVHGIRTEARRAGRPVAVFGISQGGVLPRMALTYWPSLRRKVTDVVAAAGTQHGTTVASRICSRTQPCPPAAWQQRAGSALLRALNSRPDETPGPTSWTTVRSSSDETVQPQTGRHPTSALRGASNILIQAVCPGRTVSHFGTAVDSVTGAAFFDAIAHRGPARASRFPADTCSHPFIPGLDENATRQLLDASSGILGNQVSQVPLVPREPKVRSWVR